MSLREKINSIKEVILDYIKETSTYRDLPALDQQDMNKRYNGVSYKYIAEYVCNEDQDLVNFALIELGDEKLLGFVECLDIRGLSFNRYRPYQPSWHFNINKKTALRGELEMIKNIYNLRKVVMISDYKQCFMNDLNEMFESYNKVKLMLNEEDSEIKLQNKPEMSLS